MDTKQIIGLVGSALLFVGVFAPILNMPIYGSVNYFQNGKGDGVAIIVLSILSVFSILDKKYYWLWVTGLISLGFLLFSFLDIQAKLDALKQGVATDLAGNPFAGIVQLAVRSIQIQWGWALLVLGSVLIIGAASIEETPKKEKATAGHAQINEETVPKKSSEVPTKYKCRICGKVYDSELGLAEHHEEHHYFEPFEGPAETEPPVEKRTTKKARHP